MTSSRTLDPGAIERLRRLGDEQFVRSMIELFFSFVRGKLAEARHALEHDDLNGVAGAGHAIKSTAANAGACRVQDLATRLEQVARSGEREQAELTFRELEQAYAEVTPLLEAERARLVDRVPQAGKASDPPTTTDPE